MKLSLKTLSLVLVMSLTCSPLVFAQVKTTCRHCGNYVAKASKLCPSCGKNPQDVISTDNSIINILINGGCFDGSLNNRGWEGDFSMALFLLTITNNHSNKAPTPRKHHKEQFSTGVTPWLFTHLKMDDKNAKRLRKNGYTIKNKDGHVYYTYNGTYPNQIIEDKKGYPTYNLFFNTSAGAEYFEKMLRNQHYVRFSVKNSPLCYIWYRETDGSVVYQGSKKVDNGSPLFFFRYE